MKLSQLTTDQLAEALVRITPPLCRIARDSRVLAVLDALSFDHLDAQPPLRSLSLMGEKLIPLLLTDLADDLYAVFSVLTGKPADTLRAQSGLTTLRDLMDAWDKELLTFFTSAGSAAQERS